MAWLQVRIKDDLKDKFKQKCDENKTNISKKIREWIEMYLSGNK